MNKNYIIFSLCYCLSLLSGKVISQVTVTPASGGTSICVGGSSVTLGPITLAETSNNDIPNGAQTYTLNAPSNFQFDNTAVLNYGGTTPALSGMSPSYTPTTLTITFNVSSTGGQIDQLVINGIEIKSITAPAFGNIVSNSNSLSVANTVNNGTLFSVSSPTVSISDNSGNDVICSGQSVIFTGYGATNYQFFVDGSSVQGPGAASTYTNSTFSAPSHSVYVIGTSGGCSGQSSTTTITVNASPSFTSWTPTVQSFALTDSDFDLSSGAFSTSPNGGTFIFSGNGVAPSGATYKFSPSAAGAGSSVVSCFYVVGGCTTAAITKTFVVNSAGNITGLNASYCINGGGSTLSIVPPSGKTLLAFQYYCYNCGSPYWFNIPAPNNYFNPSIIAGNAGVGYAYVQAMYTDGTTSPYSNTYIYDKPLVLIYTTGPFCQNNGKINLSFYPADNSDPVTGFSGTGVSETAPNSGVWQFDPSVGSSTITYTYKNSSDQCVNSTSQLITVNPPPVVSIPPGTFAAQYCQNSSTIAISGSPAGGTFSGSGVVLSSYTYTGLPPYYYNYVYNFAPSSASIGTQKIYYNYEDANYCSGVDSVSVIISAPAAVSVKLSGYDTTLCLPLAGIGTYQFSAKTSGPATGVSWAAYDGVIYTTGGNAGSYSASAPASGYTSGVSFTNSSYQATNNRAYINAYTTGQPVTCPVGNQYFTSYLIPPPVITITGLVKNSYCNNEPNFTLQGSAQYNYVVSSLGVVSSGTASVTTFGPVPPNPPDPALVGAVFQPFSASTGNHPIRYSYTDPNGCSNFHDTTIIINASPVAGFEIDSGYCATKLTYFKDTSTVPPGTTLSYSWNFGDGTTLADTSHLQNPTYKYLVAGGFPVSLIVQTNQGCSNSTILPNNKLLIIQTIPTSNFSYKYQCLGDLTVFDTLSIVELGAFKSRTWIFSNALNIPFDTLYQTSSVSTGYTFPGSGDYKVTVVDSTTLGCTNRLKKPLFILPYITPTSSSPYAVSFQNTSGGWGQDGTKSSWVHSVPLPAKKPNMYYGGKGITDSVWVTSADTSYNIGEKSSLNSPCFNFNQLNKPMISLKLWTVTQAQIAGAVLNVSVDDGITWNTLGKQGDGVNWYNNIGIAGSPGTLSTNDGWSGIDTSWQQAKLGLSAYANYDPTKKVRFRVTFGAPSDSTIARSEGIALDSVWVGNRNKVVMMEHFTNNTANGSTTPAIAVANDTINTIRDTRSNDVAAVYYHTSFPAQDPFNAFYPQGPSSRVLYYGISSAPWTILDGNFYNGNIYSGGTPTSKIGVNDIDARSLETAIFNLSMTTSFNPGVATVAAKVTYTGSTSFAKDVVLNTVITQDDSSGVVKYGSIVRQMLPDAGGSYISKTWNTNDSLIQVNSWNHNLPSTAKLGAVIFVQDPSTREIYQAAYFRGTGSYGSPVITGVQGESSQGFKVNMFPNPATDEVFFIYGKAIRENATWEVYDNTGRKVAEGVCSAGREGFSINTSNFSGGVYHVKLSGDNGAMDTKELIVIH